MENTTYISLSRQVALWNQLDMVSNNLANMNTTGFKSVQPHFTDYISKSKNDEHLLSDRIHFTHDFGIVRDFAEGAFTSTSNATDVALHGKGFFVIDTNEGVRYTRNGQFKISEEGMLTTADNYPVLDDRNLPIFIAPEETKLDINQDGTIATENGVIAKFAIVDFDDLQNLRETHGGLYANVKNQEVRQARNVQVEQGMIERSNVNAVSEMTQMIKLQRAYENIQMMIDGEHTRRQNMMNVYTKNN
ncbi:MAG: flagellar basal-body rod protein FlgF [Alphaproteobacteria bacterium]|nr:flagellar basal-body rod protein FlgF [Alphaproteobacteria bacterium]